MKTCSRCHKVKPADSFSRCKKNKDGLQAWCQDCVNGRVREWHRDNPNFVFPQQQHTLLQRDPIEYTKRTCAHVAAYIGRTINRLEQSGLEPPPQLTAIHQMATRFADQQADLADLRRTCEYCGITFQQQRAQGGKRRYCSDICKHRMAWLKRDKQAMNTQKRAQYHERNPNARTYRSSNIRSG